VWLTSVVRVLDMPPACKSVLREFCDYANANFMGWPGTDSLAAATGYCERNVQKHIRCLEENGVLERIPGKFTYRGQLIETVLRRVDLDMAIRVYGIDSRLKLPSHWRAGAKSINDLAIPQRFKGLKKNDGDSLRPYVAQLRTDSKRRMKKSEMNARDEGDSVSGESPALPKRISCTQTTKNLKEPISDAVATSESVDVLPRVQSVSGTPATADVRDTLGASSERGSDENLDAAGKRSATKLWQKHADRIRRDLGITFWTSWLSKLQPEDDDGETLILSAPTGFGRDWLSSSGIVQLGKIEKILARRVKVVLRQNRSPGQRGTDQ
jgi:hypothetical protein